MKKILSELGGFAAGVTMTVGLLISPHLNPQGWGYGWSLQWDTWQTAMVLAGGLAAFVFTVWLGGRIIGESASWREPRFVTGTIFIAVTANTLYTFLVEIFMLKSGMRALVALAGLPIIYGNIGAKLAKTTLGHSMFRIFTGALATMGAGYIVAALIKGW